MSNSFDLNRVYRVALGQRALNLCILASLALVIAAVALPGASGLGALLGVVGLLAVGAVVSLASAGSVAYLAAAIWGIPIAIVLFVLLVGRPVVDFMFPQYNLGTMVVYLAILIIVNSRATKVMREAGFSVGLLGASPGDVKVRMSQAR